MLLKAMDNEQPKRQDLYDLVRSRKRHVPLGEVSTLFPPTVWHIPPLYALKRVQSPTEVFMMQYVALHTTIPVPKVFWTLPAEPDDDDTEHGWALMEYVGGETLDVAWPKMSLWRRSITCLHLWWYRRQLHSVPLPQPNVPGPFNEAGQPLPCQGRYFTEDSAGPFPSYSAMTEWFERRRLDCLVTDFHRHQRLTGLKIPPFDDSQPLVLCHMDLHLKNIIYDHKTGKLWIIDWAYAGAYPAWFDYTIAIDYALHHTAKRSLGWWKWAAQLVMGRYETLRVEYVEKMSLVWSGLYDRHTPTDYCERKGLIVEDDQIKYLDRSRTP